MCHRDYYIFVAAIDFLFSLSASAGDIARLISKLFNKGFSEGNL